MSTIVPLTLSIGSDMVSFGMSDEDGRDYVVQQASARGLAFYEPPLPTVLMALAQEAEGAFVDVGANTGIYTLLVAAANPSIPVYAFEPIHDIRAVLDRNMGSNREISSSISVFGCALSDRSGTVLMQRHVNPAGLIATSSTLEAAAGLEREYEALEVQRCTLDAWSEAKGPISFLKIDVEGHERAVVEGARNIIRRDRPFVAVELLSGADFTYFGQFLKAFSYMDLALKPDEITRVESPHFVAEAWNHLLCPLEKSWAFARACCRASISIS